MMNEEKQEGRPFAAIDFFIFPAVHQKDPLMQTPVDFLDAIAKQTHVSRTHSFRISRENKSQRKKRCGK